MNVIFLDGLIDLRFNIPVNNIPVISGLLLKGKKNRLEEKAMTQTQICSK